MLCSSSLQIPTRLANNLLALISDKNLFKFHRNVILKMLLLYRKKKNKKLNEDFLSLVVLEKLTVIYQIKKWISLWT